jgi:plastocyanin
MKRLTAIVCCGLVLAACGGGGERAGGGEEEAAAGGGAAGPTGSGSISGAVRFTGTAPANPTIDMSEEPACREKHPSAPVNPKVVVNNGMLGNVFVYVKSGLPAGATYPAPTTPAVIDQNGCMYDPRVFGVLVGQSIEIRNSDPVLHNIKAVPSANRGFNISQPSQGMTTTRRFDTPEVMVPLECNVHGWMNAWVGVVTNPFFAVSAQDGSFTIGGLPAGTYEVEAWHETMGTKTATVTVGEGAAATVEFSFGPTT